MTTANPQLTDLIQAERYKFALETIVAFDEATNSLTHDEAMNVISQMAAIARKGLNL